MTIFTVKNSVDSEASLPKGYLVALARYSVTRSRTACHPDHVGKFHAVVVGNPPLYPRQEPLVGTARAQRQKCEWR